MLNFIRAPAFSNEHVCTSNTRKRRNGKRFLSRNVEFAAFNNDSLHKHKYDGMLEQGGSIDDGVTAGERPDARLHTQQIIQHKYSV